MFSSSSSNLHGILSLGENCQDLILPGKSAVEVHPKCHHAALSRP